MPCIITHVRELIRAGVLVGKTHSVQKKSRFIPGSWQLSPHIFQTKPFQGMMFLSVFDVISSCILRREWLTLPLDWCSKKGAWVFLWSYVTSNYILRREWLLFLWRGVLWRKLKSSCVLMLPQAIVLRGEWLLILWYVSKEEARVFMFLCYLTL